MSHDLATVLIVDDEDDFRTGLHKRLRRKGFDTFSAATGREALDIASQNLLDVALVDIRMPGMDGIELLSTLKEAHPSIEVIILTGAATVKTAIEAMKLGAYDYMNKPCRFDKLQMLIEKAYEKKRLREQNMLLERELRRLAVSAELIGSSEKAMEIRTFIKLAAQADCPVLIEGESGVGKELIAREIHRQSPRADAPFIVLDCGGALDTLLADELFGHERGAFTTAIESRQGLLEIAHGGTLLIDEVGEMSPASQAALLRVVETQMFRRIGGSKELSVNVRILASTNRNLRKEVELGRFREDLLFRLEVLHLVVPPLMERKDDIPLLVEHFLISLNRAKGKNKRLGRGQMEFLMNHRWPGNIRELANLIERGFFMSPDDEIIVSDYARLTPLFQDENTGSEPREEKNLSEIEREHVLRMLASKKGNKKATAIALGISRSRLYNLLKKFGFTTSPRT